MTGVSSRPTMTAMVWDVLTGLAWAVLVVAALVVVVASAVLVVSVLTDTSKIILVTGQILECRYVEIGAEVVCQTRGGGEIRLPPETIQGFGRRGVCNS